MAYEDDYDYIEETYDSSGDDSSCPDAKVLRDNRARELRRDGWTVQIETYHGVFKVFAEKRKRVVP